ncbi:Mitochondrial metal transporter 2 [Tolypocladium ophioglossoides CBS 100239]|uniref:Mitochondrial metal transporter 2 n=1 Tax=Tolypocladium ophioglossoides (strain CBS 100239) TaxID=1163406 RepID=A0A0L0NE20_TOLOC|nr:Mitochondrial metal transporter 2 [Tolypocladium ophioglossoides CBS 100239]
MSPQARRSTGLAVWCVSGATPAAAATRCASRRGRAAARRQAQPARFPVVLMRTPSHKTPSAASAASAPAPAPASASASASAAARLTRHVQQTVAFSSSASCSAPAPAAPSPSSASASSPCHSSLLLAPHLLVHHHHHPDAAIATARCVLVHLAPVRGRIRPLPAIMGSALQQTRDHGDHGHGHGHGHGHHDTSYLISANKNDSGVRITRIGLLSNLGMAIAKFIGGWAFNSKSMTADAWHSIADLASDVLTLATVSWSLKPPSDRFPMGFGKVESLGSLGVSGMLLVGGFYMGWESAISLYGHFNPELAHEILEHVGHGHSHSHGAASLGIPSIHAVWLAAGTILIKEWLYHASELTPLR